MTARSAELKRQYKLAPPAMGVYRVRNLLSGAQLIAASGNPEGALNRLRFELRMGQHRDAALQADWHAVGEAGLEFVVLAILDDPDPALDPQAELALLLQRQLSACGARMPGVYGCA
ncbi:MAG TPA: GIY-YIG nuclease family protein [Burkholderiaceae bacterium]